VSISFGCDREAALGYPLVLLARVLTTPPRPSPPKGRGHSVSSGLVAALRRCAARYPSVVLVEAEAAGEEIVDALLLMAALDLPEGEVLALAKTLKNLPLLL
jgi:hypothetical protein